MGLSTTGLISFPTADEDWGLRRTHPRLHVQQAPSLCSRLKEQNEGVAASGHGTGSSSTSGGVALTLRHILLGYGSLLLRDGDDTWPPHWP